MNQASENVNGKGRDGRKTALFVAVLVFLSLAVVEVVLHLAGFFGLMSQYDDTRYRLLPQYKDKAWSEEFWREAVEAKMRYEPLLGWRHREYHGEYLNIDAAGIRKTWDPPAPSSAKTVSIFMLGGSTMWGGGARDDYTIPSYVSKSLNGSGTGVGFAVTNYAEGGYVFPQEIIQLVTLIKNGYKPDYVVFYDGVNDVATSYETGTAGAVSQVDLIQQQLGSTNPERIWLGVKGMIKDDCALCNVAVNVVRRFSPQSLRLYEIAGLDYSDEQLLTLAKQTAESYKKSLAFIDALSKTFHFRYVAFWQPSIFTESKLVGYENQLGKIDPRVDDKKIALLQRETTRLLPNDPAMNFYDIHDILAGRTSECYIDNAHISENCNELVARKMVELLKADGLK
jgi:lysophospholipase L1-like esterase